MKILVTGGAGFIGSHLVEELVKAGHSVVVMDDLSLGTEDNLAKVKLSISFYNHGYEDKDFLRKVVREHRIECIFHFAGYSSAPMFDGRESDGISLNIAGFARLLEVCRDEKIRRLVYASSSSIYGNAPIQEESVKVSPPNFYALTKYAMEHMARLFYDLYKVESVGFRFFSVYGRNEKHKKQYANLVSQFLWAIQEGKDVVIYGDGSQTRDFVYVMDLCKALIMGMEAPLHNASVFNLGTSDTYSLNQMIDILEQATGLNAKRKHVKNPVKNYVAHTKADTLNATRELGWKPSYSLKDGITDIIGAK